MSAVAAGARARLRLGAFTSLTAFSAAAVGAGLGRALVTTYVPVLLHRIRDAPGLIGTVMLVNTVAGFVVPLWIGLWSDSLRARGHGRTLPFIAGGSLMAAGGLLAIGLGHESSYAALALLALVVYAGLNAITTAHRALIPETFDERRRGTATGAEELAMLVGGLAGVMVGGALIEVAGWAPFAFGAAALPLLALPTLRNMRGREDTVRAAAGTRREPARYYLAAARRPGARLVLAAQILWVLGYVGLAPFFVVYSEEVLALRPSAAAAMLGAFGAIAGVSVLAAGAVPPDHQVQSLLGGVVLMGGGLLGVAATTSMEFVVPALLAAAVGFGLVTTLGFAVFTRYIPPGEEGSYSALFFSSRAVASAIALPAAGWTIAFAHTYRAVFVFGGAAALLALAPLSALGSAGLQRPRIPRPGAVLGPVFRLALATVAALAAGLAFAKTSLERLDEACFDALFGLGSAPLVLDAVLVDPHIQNYVALTLVSAAMAVVWRRDELARVLALVPLAGLVSFGVVRLIWAVWDRSRPEEVLGIDPANGHIWQSYPSFPSGHVVVTVAIVAAATSSLRWLGAFLWPYAALVALTRVTFGAHFPSDVVLGAILGYVSARTVVALLAGSGVLPVVRRRTPALALSRRIPSIATPTRIAHAARAWTGVAVVAFAVLAVTVGPPQAPEGGILPTSNEEAIQLGLLALAAAGAAAARFSMLLGAAALLGAGVALGILASVEYHPLFAFAACLAFFLPGLLLLAVRFRGLAALGVAGVAAALLAVGGATAVDLHDRAYGPTHPESALRAAPVQLVRWIWAGGVGPRSARVTAKLDRDAPATLIVSPNPSLVPALRSAPRTADHDRNDRVVSFRVGGLQPSTRYFYAVEAGGSVDRSRLGRFTTAPIGSASFTVAFGGCARVGSNGAVFDAIRRTNPLLFLVVGDFFYGNVERDDPEEFRNLYEQALSQPAQSALYRSAPIAYVWDDHDFGGNDADGTSASRAAAQEVYRALVPSYALPAGREAGPIYQAFTIGRVRFLLTDTRSERTPARAPDDRRKTMLGTRQKAWLKRELLRSSGRYPLIVWVNSVPWIGPPTPGDDSWAGYATERRELGDFVARHGIRGLVMVSGDAHMTAIDDGTHSNYSRYGGSAFPVVHAAALDRRGDVKGGPYSEGTFPGSGQFGTLTVRDRGSRLDVELAGWRYTGRLLVSYRFSVPGPSR